MPQGSNDVSDPYQLENAYVPIGQRDTTTRSAFINKTYNHLMGAIVGFTLFEVWLFTSGLAERIAMVLLGGSWLIVLGGFILVNWIATRVAFSSSGLGAQYAALAGFVAAEGIIFVPMLYIANTQFPGVIESAAFTTLAGFAGLTAVAFVTRKDFSFLRGVLMYGGIMPMVVDSYALQFMG